MEKRTLDELEMDLRNTMNDYIADDGFTENVVVHLPTRPIRSWSTILVALTAIVSCTIALWIAFPAFSSRAAQWPLLWQSGILGDVRHMAIFAVIAAVALWSIALIREPTSEN